MREGTRAGGSTSGPPQIIRIHITHVRETDLVATLGVEWKELALSRGAWRASREKYVREVERRYRRPSTAHSTPHETDNSSGANGEIASRDPDKATQRWYNC